jgi:hypothetical protein
VIPGNVELVEVVASMTANTAGVAAILYADERFRSSHWGADAWLPATRDAAVLGAFLFGWIYGGPALIIHFVKSRGWLIGPALGVLCAALVVGVDFGLQLCAGATIDWLGL